MQTILTCRSMQELDKNTIENIGVPSAVLMERAALSVFERIMDHISGLNKEPSVLCVCGSGNNGGDGIAVARLLFNAGINASVYMAGSRSHLTEETARQIKIAENYGVRFWDQAEDFSSFDIIVDAIFGIGLSRTVEGHYADLIGMINKSGAWVLGVDIPSGINGDTGQIMGCAVKCDETVTMAFRKAGHILYPGRRFCGKLICADIGIYRSDNENAKEQTLFALEKTDLSPLLYRDPEGNKATFGKIVCVTGSPGMCGASYLCSSAAMRSGAGMVMIRTAEENRISLQTLLPEAMLSFIPGEEEETRIFAWSDVIALGCGLGMSPASAQKVHWYLKKCHETNKPLILDADGLNHLAAHPEWEEYLGPNVILTPHPGEMSRISGFSVDEIKSDPVMTASAYAKRTGSVVVQKDACTVIASPEGGIFLNESGNSGMGTAGSGDVLCGVIAGVTSSLITKPEITAFMAAALGVYIHGLAGDEAALIKGKCGMKAGDITEALPQVLRESTLD